MPHKPLLILKTGSTVPAIHRRRGDFQHWFIDAMSLAADDVRTVDAQADELPANDTHRGIVITGSAAMVTEQADWMRHAEEWLVEAVERGLPVLGVCFGHQLLAHALGGGVGPVRGGREIGTVEVKLERAAGEDLLLHGLPTRFAAQTTHEEAVLELPQSLVRLARTEKDDNAAFNVPGKRVWGVQFHPEFDADIMRGYLEGRRDALAREGLKPDRLLAEVHEAPVARRILHRFAALAR